MKSRRVPLALAVIALVLVGLEVGARVFGSPWDGARSRERASVHFEELSGPWAGPGSVSAAPADGKSAILHPFTGWQTAEVQERVAGDLGTSSVYDVYLLGGSGAVALASALAGRGIEVHPYGIDGFKQPQSERLLAYLLSSGHRPDAVIEFDGFDEAALGWKNALAGISPLYPAAETWGKLTEGLRFDWQMVGLLHELDETRSGARTAFGRHLDLQLWRSAFLDQVGWRILDAWLSRIEETGSAIRSYAATRGLEAELAGPRASTEPAEVGRMIVSSWEEASFDMHAMCERRGIAYLHVLEPAGPGAGTGVERVHPRLREAGRRLAERGIAFLDGADVLDDHPDVLFDASGRIGDLGLQILAESAARALPVR